MSNLSVALSSLIYVKISAHFIVNTTAKMAMIDRSWTHNDYPKCTEQFWPFYSLRSDLTKLSGTTPNRQICKGDYFTMESVYWSHRGKKNVIIYTQNKDKIRGQKSFKDDTKCIITHLVCLIGPYEACNLCTQICWVTHTPWKLTETYSGCHITQPIQHITLCCQGPWPT